MRGEMSDNPMGHLRHSYHEFSHSWVHSFFLSLFYFNIYSFTYGPQVHRIGLPSYLWFLEPSQHQSM